MQDQQEQGKPAGPGKRVHRISAICRPGIGTVHCLFYTTKAGSFRITDHYCQISLRQYSHLASIVNEAAERGYGEVEAHSALPGFVWYQAAYGQA